MAAHQRHGRRTLQAPQRQERNADPKFATGAAQPEGEKTGDAKRKTNHQRRAFADLFRHRPNNGALDDDRCDPDAGQRQSDDALVKAIAVQHVQHGDARQHRMRKIAEEVDGGEPQQLAVRTQ
jgi:hypothetical protein